jgi:hypothetical protein
MSLVLILAFFDGMLLPAQMAGRYKIGFPAVANGAIWGNLILLSAALYLIGAYRGQWSSQEIGTALGFGIAISYGLFEFVYLKGKFPDALAGGGKDISPAGWVMLIYSAGVYAAIGLFYLRTNATLGDVLVVAGLLTLYIPVANHAVLGWLNSTYSWPWCPRIFAEESSPLFFIVGGEILVVLATVVKLDPPLWKPFW